jgi:hypothetical protein
VPFFGTIAIGPPETVVVSEILTRDSTFLSLREKRDGETYDDLSPIEQWLCQPTQFPHTGPTYSFGNGGGTEGKSDRHLWPVPRPRVTYTWLAVQTWETDETRTSPVLLTVTEGVYVGERIEDVTLIAWDEIESSTIPLSDLKLGHPPT